MKRLSTVLSISKFKQPGKIVSLSNSYGCLPVRYDTKVFTAEGPNYTSMYHHTIGRHNRPDERNLLFYRHPQQRVVPAGTYSTLSPELKPPKSKVSSHLLVCLSLDVQTFSSIAKKDVTWLSNDTRSDTASSVKSWRCNFFGVFDQAITTMMVLTRT